VNSQHMSNGKKKGEGNTRNGNQYLSWAFVEAANFAIRFSRLLKYRRRASSRRAVDALI